MENKKFIIAIVILSLLLTGTVGFIVYDKFFKKQDETIRTVINGMEIDLNVFHKIGDTLNNLDAAFNDPTNKYFGYIYGDGNVMIEKLEPSVAAYAAIYKEIVKTGTNQVISASLVKSNMNNMFGKYVTYKADAIEWLDGAFMPYDKDTETYSQQLPFINPIKDPSYFAVEISSAIGHDEVIIKRKSYYAEYALDESGTKRVKASIYTDKSKKTLITTMNLKNGVINEKEVISKYGSKLNTYTYTFKEYNDTEYVLYSIEKIIK